MIDWQVAIGKRSAGKIRLQLDVEQVILQIAAARGIPTATILREAVESYLTNEYPGIWYKLLDKRYELARAAETTS